MQILNDNPNAFKPLHIVIESMVELSLLQEAIYEYDLMHSSNGTIDKNHRDFMTQLDLKLREEMEKRA